MYSRKLNVAGRAAVLPVHMLGGAPKDVKQSDRLGGAQEGEKLYTLETKGKHCVKRICK